MEAKQRKKPGQLIVQLSFQQFSLDKINALPEALTIQKQKVESMGEMVLLKQKQKPHSTFFMEGCNETQNN